jgi:2',3'-cyclic-nucleotide 2'-phosphodiesterase (5'-nucleotidase family)
VGPPISRHETRAPGGKVVDLRSARRKTLQADPGAGIDVIVSGHSHVPRIDRVGGVLYLNPGSAGRRRFRLPITLATLEVTRKSTILEATERTNAEGIHIGGGECANSLRLPVTPEGDRYLRGRSRSRTTSFARLSDLSPR